MIDCVRRVYLLYECHLLGRLVDLRLRSDAVDAGRPHGVLEHLEGLQQLVLYLISEVLVPFGRQGGPLSVFLRGGEAVVFDLLSDVLCDLPLEPRQELGVRVFVGDFGLHGRDAFGEELLRGSLAA